MKRFYFTTLVALAAAAALVSGCIKTMQVSSNTGTNGVVTLTTNIVSTLDTNAVVSAINAVVPAAVSYACSKDTNAAPYFVQAALVLKAASDAGQYDPAQIEASLSKISIRQLRTQTAIDAENAGLSIYKAFFGQVVDQQLAKVLWLDPILQGLANAIQAGIPAQ